MILDLNKGNRLYEVNADERISLYTSPIASFKNINDAVTYMKAKARETAIKTAYSHLWISVHDTDTNTNHFILNDRMITL